MLLLNAGILHRVGPSRVYVKLARRLADLGFPVLRFDFSGIGDSEPRKDGVRFDDAVVTQVTEAIDYLEKERRFQNFVVGGICSGADVAFRAAIADPRVVGLLQVDGYAYRNARYYFHHYGRRVLNFSNWKSFMGRHLHAGLRSLGLRWIPEPSEGKWKIAVRHFPPKEEVEEGLRSLVFRGVDQFHIHSAGQEQYYNYGRQFQDNFSSVDFRGKARFEYLSRANHTFKGLDQQELLVSTISRWMIDIWGSGPEIKTIRGSRNEGSEGDSSALSGESSHGLHPD